MSDAEVYNDCWSKYWMENKSDPCTLESADSIVWSWRPKKAGPYSRMKIPSGAAKKAQEGLSLIGAMDSSSPNVPCNEIESV